MNVYLDTSAYVKRYLNENNSDRIDSLFEDAYNKRIQITTSVLTIGEASIVFDKYSNRGIISNGDEFYEDFMNEMRYLRMIDSMNVIDLNTDIMIQSGKMCIDKHRPLADVIHIVSSLHNSDLFVTSDREQNKIARESNLKTELV